MNSNSLPAVFFLPDGFVDGGAADPEDAKRITTNNQTGGGDVSIKKTEKPRTFPVTLCEEEDDNELSSKLSSGEKESSQTSSESTQSIDSSFKPRTQEEEAVETKLKTSKNMFKSEQDFLEFMLKYQQVLSERDSAITIRDKLESLCRELQHQNKLLMEECKRLSTEGQTLRSDLSTQFQDAIKEVSIKLDKQKDESLSQLKENETLRTMLKHLADQYMLSEQQHERRLKQKTLELEISELKIKQHEENLIHEQSRMKVYSDQVSQLLATEKNLRLQPTSDGEKFQQFQDALVKSNEVIETFKQEFKQEIDKMSEEIKELRKENAFFKTKSERSDFTLTHLVEERERSKKLLEKTKNQKDTLESLCRSLQAERKQKQSNSNDSAAAQA